MNKCEICGDEICKEEIVHYQKENNANDIPCCHYDCAEMEVLRERSEQLTPWELLGMSSPNQRL